MTSIEFLKDWMSKNQYFIGNDLLEAFEEASFIHKQEIIDAFKNGNHTEMRGGKVLPIISERYYQETFVSKGSYVNGDIVTKDSIVREVVEDDVDKLAEDYAFKTYHELEDAKWFTPLNVGFRAGYNKAKESLYTEEQLDKAISWGINSGRKGDVTITDIDNFIQSLKQPKQ